MRLKVLGILCFMACAAFAQTNPKPLTNAERMQVMELLTEKYAADAEETEIRTRLEQLAQQQIGESRKRRETAIRAVEDKILSLAATHGVDTKAWILDMKSGAWKKREATSTDSTVAAKK